MILQWGTFVFVLALFVQSFGSVVKKTSLEGQDYLCRPAHLEPKCTLSTDIGFLTGLAADSADAFSCLKSLSETNDSTVQQCFLQRRIRLIARELDIQISSGACWNELVDRCREIKPCPQDVKLKCGHLGLFLQTIEDLKLDSFFTKADGEKLCNSLAN